MVYDWLAVIALLMLATVVNLIVLQMLVSYQLINLPEGMEPSTFLNMQWWFKVELALVILFFYAWFWHDGGQTLGMRSWRLKVQTQDDQPLSLNLAILRAIYAVFGLGNVLVLLTPKTKLALQDKLTKTEVIVLSKEANKKVYLRGVEAQE